MVVGGREHHDLADPELGEHFRVGRGVLGGVAERSDADDGALAGHEARHRLGRAERAGIGDRDRHPGEVVDRELVRAHLAHEVLVGVQELGEIERVGRSDARHEERPATAWALVVDGDAEPDVLVADDPGRAGRLDVRHERSVHRRDRAEGLDHGPGDQVGEADLAAGGARELIVDDGSVDLEKLGGDGVNAGGASAPRGWRSCSRRCGQPRLEGAPRPRRSAKEPPRSRRRAVARRAGWHRQRPAAGRRAVGGAGAPLGRSTGSAGSTRLLAGSSGAPRPR